jgi:hypothetical protein
VRLGVPGDKPDPLVGTGRISLSQNANSSVSSAIGSPPGGDCNDKPGCDRTVFVNHGGIKATAPTTTGVVKTTWQLVDESRAWFGPVMWLTFRVMDCPDGGSAGGDAIHTEPSARAVDGSLGDDVGGGGGGGGDGPPSGLDGGSEQDSPHAGGCAVASSVGSREPSGWGAAWLGVAVICVTRLRRRPSPSRSRR